MNVDDKAELPGSRRREPAHARHVGAVADDEPIAVSIYLKPVDVLPDPTEDDRQAMRRTMSEHRAEAHRDGIAAIAEFAAGAGLEVTLADPARRLVRLAGPAARMQAAFGTTLERCEEEGHSFRCRVGKLHVPHRLLPFIESVLGLDDRPAGRRREPEIEPQDDTAPATSPALPPGQVGQLYKFPPGVTGAGQTVALIELGGGYFEADLVAVGIDPKMVTAVSVDGAVNQQVMSRAHKEVALDIQVVAGVAPGARIVVYFAPNSQAGFADAISMAVHDAANRPGVISISWGMGEGGFASGAIRTINAALEDAARLGIPVFVAAGDYLATDGVADGKAHVQFPASSPFVVSCGGTALALTDAAISDEIVWNTGARGTGGGISDVFDVPDFQQAVALPASVNGGRKGRGVPDVAGSAASVNGYAIHLNGVLLAMGGTSAVAPLWAGLVALINERAKRPVGFLTPFLYANPHLLRPVVSGHNRPPGSAIGYDGAAPWNACTGLGVPDGAALFAALTGT